MPASPENRAVTIHLSDAVYAGLIAHGRKAGYTPTLYAKLLFEAAYAARCGKGETDALLANCVAKSLSRTPPPPVAAPPVEIVRPLDGETEQKAGPFARRTRLGYPALGWTCFHCGETFTTPGAAQDHFGCSQSDDPACRIKMGEERGLVMALRKAEAEIRRLCSEEEDYRQHIAAASVALPTPVLMPVPVPVPVVVEVRSVETIEPALAAPTDVEHLAATISEGAAKLEDEMRGPLPKRAPAQAWSSSQMTFARLVCREEGASLQEVKAALAPSYQEKTSLLVLISAVRKKLASEGITFEAVDVWGWRVERHCRAAAQTFLEAAP